MYGVTHVCAIDGYSNMIVGTDTMPIKNAVEVYDQLYRYPHKYSRFDGVYIGDLETIHVLMFSQTYSTPI